MSFNASLCHPLKSEKIDLGELKPEEVIDCFERISWLDLLKEMDGKNEENIYFSPSFGIENNTNKNGLEFSLIDETEWYIFFKRPKLITKFFGLSKKMDHEFASCATEQTITDVKKCLNAFINHDLNFLEQKIR